MTRNVHQSRKNKNRKPAASPGVPAKPAAAVQTETIKQQVKTAGSRASALQEAEAAQYADLPYDIKRIALFSAFVVVLLIVLWFFLK